MTKELESRKDLVDEKATRHEVTRHCEEDVVRRGNLLNGLLRHFVPRNDENRDGNPPTLTLPLTHFKKAAFTLAEVLITLGVIGIVAAMTIPTMINNYQKKLTLTKLQKAYSTLTNAIKLSEIDNGNISTWDFSDPENIMKNNIAKYIKHSKVYGPSRWVTPLCHERQVTNVKGYTYSWLDGVFISSPFTDDNNWSVLTNDGICIGYAYKYFFIDVNSSINPPNVAGKDLFFFIYYNGKIEPRGYELSYEDLTNAEVVNSCNAKAKWGGAFCAAKIMKDGWTMKDDYPW